MGRPRTFDTDLALDQMVSVFWSKGYDGTTLTDLTEATGVQRPSLYAAFGDKKTVFEKVVARYVEGPSAYVKEALAEDTARAVAEALLRGAADLHTAPGTPPGCLMVRAVPLGGDTPAEIESIVIAHRAQVEAKFRKRFRRAAAEGESLPHEPAELAAYLRTVIDGMAIRAAGGASHRDLDRVVKLALDSWPE
jgi:AcrR family transcriptional regulator